MKTEESPKAMAGEIPVYCAHDDIIPTDDLRPYPRNAKRHPKAQIDALQKLIEHHGWRHPITVSHRSGYIVRGHARLKVAQSLGLTAVPVDYQHYDTDEDERADRLADNRIPELGEVDIGLLHTELIELDTAPIDIGLTGFDSAALKEIKKYASEKQDKEQLDQSEDDKNFDIKWKIIVQCRDENHQRELLEFFNVEGLPCQALML